MFGKHGKVTSNKSKQISNTYITIMYKHHIHVIYIYRSVCAIMKNVMTGIRYDVMMLECRVEVNKVRSRGSGKIA